MTSSIVMLQNHLSNQLLHSLTIAYVYFSCVYPLWLASIPSWCNEIQSMPLKLSVCGLTIDDIWPEYPNEILHLRLSLWTYRRRSQSHAEVLYVFTFQGMVLKQTNAIQNLSVWTRTVLNALISRSVWNLLLIIFQWPYLLHESSLSLQFCIFKNLLPSTTMMVFDVFKASRPLV